jgi:hypothetical protein
MLFGRGERHTLRYALLDENLKALIVFGAHAGPTRFELHDSASRPFLGQSLKV